MELPKAYVYNELHNIVAEFDFLPRPDIEARRSFYVERTITYLKKVY